MLICGSCGRGVDHDSTDCPRCGGLVSTLALALDLARRADDLTPRELRREWRRLSKHEQTEVLRLRAGRLDVPRSGRKTLGLALAVLGVGLLAILIPWPRLSSSPTFEINPLADADATASPALRQPLDPGPLVPQRCDEGLRLPQVVVASEPVDLRDAPTIDAGTRARVGLRTLLRIECRRDGWARLEVLQPPALKGRSGWIPSNLLVTPVEVTAPSLERLRSSLVLEDGMQRYQQQIVAALARIRAEVPRCGALDLGSLAMSTEDGEVVFSVVCNPGLRAFNLWFDLQGRELRRPPPIAVEGATESERCAAVARRLAHVPQSVRYSRDDEVRLEHPPGTLRVVSSFSAQGAGGGVESFRIQCLFEAGDLMAWTVAR